MFLLILKYMDPDSLSVTRKKTKRQVTGTITNLARIFYFGCERLPLKHTPWVTLHIIVNPFSPAASHLDIIAIYCYTQLHRPL